TKVAKDKAAERVPKLTESAKSGARKMRGQIDRLPGGRAAESEPATVNGPRPADCPRDPVRRNGAAWSAAPQEPRGTRVSWHPSPARPGFLSERVRRRCAGPAGTP